MSNPTKIDVLIFAPTSEEREFTQNLLPEPQINCIIAKEDKKFIYDSGKIITINKTYEVILISPEKAGSIEAYDYLKHQLELWDPDLLIVVGVAGGFASQKVKIGDILLPTQITEFLLFKDALGGQEPQPESFHTSKELVIAARRFFDSNKEEIQNEHPFEEISCFSDGTILSSVALQAKEPSEKDAIAKLIKADRKMHGIEQESSGIARLMDENKSIKWMIIRSVMDLADDETRSSAEKDQNKKSATELSAKFCFKFLNWYFSKITPDNDHKSQLIVNFLNKIGNIDIICTSYDENNYLQTTLHNIKGNKKVFDLEGKAIYRNAEIRLFIDINKKLDLIEIEEEFYDFIQECFGIWVNKNIDHDWFARFLFISDRPFFCSEHFSNFKTLDFLRNVLNENESNLLKYLEEFENKIERNFLSLLNIIFITEDSLAIFG